jgi:hypothetical protein
MTTQIAPETTAPKTFVFVLMPFDATFNDAYQLGIKPACTDAGAYCERVDEQIFEGNMLARIYNQIAKADILIADMTGRNPNVFYEVGYAHALGKTVVLLTQKSEDIPFDLKHYPHIVYGSSVATLKTELTRRVKWFVERPNSAKTAFAGLELYCDGQKLESGLRFSVLQGWSPTIKIDVFNNSTAKVMGEDYQIGILYDPTVLHVRHPDGEPNIFWRGRVSESLAACLATAQNNLLPLSWDGVQFEFMWKMRAAGFETKAFFRLITQIGITDYPIVLAITGDNKDDLAQRGWWVSKPGKKR